MKKILLLLVSVFGLAAVTVNSQQRPIYDQYHFNYYLINPAVAGADKCSHLMATGKQSWLGADGPSTYLLSYRTRLNTKNIGLGGYIYNDHTPQFNYIGGQFTFAYHIPMSIGGKYSQKVELDRQLSFGISARVKYLKYDAVENVDDPANISEGEFMPDVNLGVYYVSYGFFAGASATNLIKFQPDMLGDSYTDEYLTAFLFMGYDFDFSRERTLEPSVNFNLDTKEHRQAEFNLKYMQNNSDLDFGWWAQLSYRHCLDKGNAQPLSLIPIVGARFGKFQLAYAFNLSLNEMASHNYGTHELMLAYTFCIPKRFCR
ncbi:MAG: PorP/SprF family type IX secretion system membrane protein [Paludibacteraceae bacterium]|nr:PorP/SprF family type IX secretion system membrane protein [Paludibacteraceae bacterium]